MKQKLIVLPLLLALVIPVSADARHGSGWNVDRGDLDEDVVGLFPIPVLFGIAYDDIYPSFGDPRGGGTRSHEGEDIIAPKGAPIVSPTEAIVIRTGTGDSAGKYVYTANPGGETFRYMHLDTIANISSGDKLDVGDLIGTVGDTGNAPDGVYHLHLEVRDEDNEATDPYPRMEDEFTLKEKISFVKDILRKVDGDEDDYAEFLVETYTSDFKQALNLGYDMPDEIIDALEDMGIVSAAEAEESLAGTLEAIPIALQLELSTGDDNLLVALLQIYLIYTTEGPERSALKAAGPTGYYGSITAGAVRAFQDDANITETGVYDADTREEMMDVNVTLNLN